MPGDASGCALHADRKAHEQWHGDEVDDRRPDAEEDRSRDQIGRKACRSFL